MSQKKEGNLEIDFLFIFSLLNNDLATTNSNLNTLSTRTLFNTTLRPITASQKTNWNYTAPHSGFLYLSFVSTVRTYCGLFLAGAGIGSVALPAAATSTVPNTITIPVFVRKGMTVGVTNLNDNCFLDTQTAFICAND